MNHEAQLKGHKSQFIWVALDPSFISIFVFTEHEKVNLFVSLVAVYMYRNVLEHAIFHYIKLALLFSIQYAIVPWLKPIDMPSISCMLYSYAYHVIVTLISQDYPRTPNLGPDIYTFVM